MKFDCIFGDIFSRDFNIDEFHAIYNDFYKGNKKYIQIHYLFDYLDTLECKFIVIENYYTDKYYLNDYLHFYGSCHKEYPRICKRIHFFNKKFDINHLFSLTEDYNSIQTELQDIYLGFSVIRPIDGKSIGRTLLKVYEETNCIEDNGNQCDKRNIIAINEYTANLCGFDLCIKSLPFQQQDKVVHACATTAIWTVLEKTNRDFSFYTPTPYEIRSAAQSFHSLYRPFPSSGLTIREIISSIRNFGMEVNVGKYTEEKKPTYHTFAAILYAYLRGGMPVLLSVVLKTKKGVSYAGHAMVATGYNLVPNQPKHSKCLLTGNRINKLYIHDDALGPFSKYLIKPQSGNTLILSCKDRGDNQVVPDALIIPIYQKIRYPFLKISEYLTPFLDNLSGGQDLRDIIEWDIFITSVNKLKKSYLQSSNFSKLDDSIRKNILKGAFPKYIWRSILLIKNIPVFEVLADATEAQTQSPYFCCFFYDLELKKNLVEDWKDHKDEKWLSILIP
ncbi:MAG: hypothetical protein ACTSVL_06765 [Promethearchaeota archaeon]